MFKYNKREREKWKGKTKKSKSLQTVIVQESIQKCPWAVSIFCDLILYYSLWYNIVSLSSLSLFVLAEFGVQIMASSFFSAHLSFLLYPRVKMIFVQVYLSSKAEISWLTLRWNLIPTGMYCCWLHLMTSQLDNSC